MGIDDWTFGFGIDLRGKGGRIAERDGLGGKNRIYANTNEKRSVFLVPLPPSLKSTSLPNPLPPPPLPPISSIWESSFLGRDLFFFFLFSFPAGQVKRGGPFFSRVH